MSNARQGWNAAQLASERRPVNRKALAPVGKPVSWFLEPLADSACKNCGYHICNCGRVFRQDPVPTSNRYAWKCGSVDPCCCDKCWAEPEPTEPALLTYDQAVAACRAGATLQITGGVPEDAKEWIGAHLRFVHGFFQTNLRGPWTFCRVEDNGVQFRIVP